MKKIAICMSLLMGQVWALSCTTPVTFSAPGQDISTLKVAVDEKGEALALWVSKNPENKEKTLFAATRDGEKKWSTAALLEPVKGITLCDFYIDAQGNQFACWKIKKEDSEGDKLEYYQFAKKEKNQAWTPAVNVLNPEDKLKYSKMSFDSQGNVLVLSHAETKDPNGSTNHSIVSVLYNHQNGEKNKTEIAKTSGYSSSQHLIKNREGKVFAWWEGSRSNYDQIKRFQSEKVLIGSWLQDNGNWSDPTTLLSFSESPSIVSEKGIMNSKGDLAMLWEKSVYGDAKTIQAVTCEDGRWSDPVDFAISKDYFLDLVFAMNDEGHVVASWQRSDKGKEVAYVVDKPAGQPWSSPIVLSTKMDPYSAKIAIDNQGNILVAWVVHEGRKEVPYAAYKPVNQEWVAPVRLSGGTQECGPVKVNTNNQGSFVVLWNEVQNKQISIHGAALSTATKEWTSARLSPEGQDCGDFKFAFNKKGQGIVAWKTTWDNEDSFVQVAELNVD